jgi:hypothetical protein
MNGIVFAAAFIALYAGHMIGDHVVQTDHQAAHKAGKGRAAVSAMAGHIGGYTAAQAVALALVAGVGMNLTAVAAGLAVSAATHAIIDRRWIVQWVLRNTGSPSFASLTSGGMNGPYLTDQALHIGCLFLAAVTVGWLA